MHSLFTHGEQCLICNWYWRLKKHLFYAGLGKRQMPQVAGDALKPAANGRVKTRR